MQCIRYVRRDPFTAKEYLGLNGEMEALALGSQYPVLLAPARPDYSRYFLIPALDFVVGSFVKFNGVYDVSEEQILRKILRPADCVVEVGSNIGSYTVILADEVGLNGTVYAFEPFRKIFHIMNANVALQGFGNVVTRQVGLGNESELKRIPAPDLNDYLNLGAARVFHQQKPEISNVHFHGEEDIEITTLDDLSPLISCRSPFDTERQPINVLKIDSEGVEKEVVQGGKEIIRRDSPLIYVESQPYFSDETDTRFVDWMRKEMNYSCSPVVGLEMHEILMCLPMNEYGEAWNARLMMDFRGEG